MMLGFQKRSRKRRSPSGARTETYSFDANGNRNMTGYVTAVSNEMTADAAGNTYSYDHAGNRTGKTDTAGNVWVYSWDYRNRLTEVTETNSSHTLVLDEKLTYLCSWQPQPVRIFRIFSVTKSLGESLRYGRGACPFGEARERVRAGGAMGESGGGGGVTRPAPARFFSSAALGEPGRFPGRRHKRHNRRQQSFSLRRAARVPRAASLPRAAPGPAVLRCVL